MKKKFKNLMLTSALALACASAAYADKLSDPQPEDSRLCAIKIHEEDSSIKQRLSDVIKQYPDLKIGYSIVHIPTGSTVSHNGNEMFPLASVFKIPVMIEFCRQMQDNELPYNLDDKFTVKKSDLCIGSGKLLNSPPGAEIDADKAINLMITISDNTATDMLINIMGTGSLRRCMQNWGFKNSRIFMTNRQAWLISLGKDSIFPDSNPEHIAKIWKDLTYDEQIGLAEEVSHSWKDISIQKFQSWEDASGAKYTYSQSAKAAQAIDNMSSPNDFSKLLCMLWNREILDDAWSEYALSVLEAQQYNTRIPRLLPKGTKTYHKTGTITAVVNDSGIIISRQGDPVAVTVFVRSVPSGRSEAAAEAIGKISRIAWESF